MNMNKVLALPVFVLGLMMVAGCAGGDGAGPDEESSEDADSTGEASEALTASGFKYGFQNWDHDGAHRDNPVSLVFVSRTSDMVDRVYGQIGDVGLTHGGGDMTLSGVGGSRPGVSSTDSWTSKSAGRKGAWGCWGHCAAKTDIHLRTYGPDGHEGTQVYQGSYGVRPYYLIATIHFDVSENTSHEDFGYQDRARSLLVDKMVGARKWRVIGSVDVKNACNRRIDAKHLCAHDGKALIVSIDG
jgi:hypothetical protein